MARVSIIVVAVVLTVAAVARGGPSPPVAPEEPFASPAPANIVDELVRNSTSCAA